MARLYAVLRVLSVTLAVVALVGCGNSGSDTDAGNSYTCVSNGGAWTCPGNAPSPQCPGNAANPINPGEPCGYDGGCFYCNRESVGIGCACNTNGDGGKVWQCVGAGYECMP